MACSCRIAVVSVCFAVALVAAGGQAEEPAKKISFVKTQLDREFRSEGAAVGDFNHDGKLDVVAGDLYYAAPDWKPTPIVENPRKYDPLNYSNSFCNFADDLNGDGWTDVIVCDFPGKETWWFENPGKRGGAWKRHVCTPVTNNESPTYLDVDRDGKRELVMAVAPDEASSDGPDRQMAILRRADSPERLWTIAPISAKAAPGTVKYSHGLGVGDVNGDGRNDVLVKAGWWESPATSSAAQWQFHAAPFGEDCAQMHVYDFDGDGDQDVLSSSAHQVGLWWHEQTPQGWTTHTIDRGFSQSHSLCLADINGDGLADFVTGKRFWAHGPKGDVNPDHPAVVMWFELSRQEGKPTWTAHEIDNDSGVGTQFEVADVDGDGLLDVVTSNKKGVHYFRQVRE